MASPEYPWRALGGGADADGDGGQRSAVVLGSYPVLLLLVILAAFVKYVWIALAFYCALLFLLSCASSRRFARRLAGGAAAAGGAAVAAVTAEEEERASALGPGSGSGLSRAAVAAAAPAFLHDPAVHGEARCAVCLEAVRRGEAARRLPACAHTFHVGCIDMWLGSHATCPLCRCHVQPRKGDKDDATAPPPLPALTALPPEPPLPPV